MRERKFEAIREVGDLSWIAFSFKVCLTEWCISPRKDSNSVIASVIGTLVRKLTIERPCQVVNPSSERFGRQACCLRVIGLTYSHMCGQFASVKIRLGCNLT